MGWWFAAAAAAEPWWAGTWGLDPSQSDDPAPLVQISDNTSAGPSTSRFAPDGAADASQLAFDHVRDETMRTLNQSGRVRFWPAGEAIDLEFDLTQVRGVPTLGSWVKVPSPDGKFRVRLWDEGERITVERRFKGLVLQETWLAPTAQDPDEAAVVVRLDGASLGAPVEFRRVYRRLDEGP